jgi:hypothetical protein
MNYIDITQSTQTLSVNLNTSESTEVVVSESGELVTNGDFSNGSANWSKDSNWSIVDGVATSTGVGRMFQSIPLLEVNIGAKVRVTFDITERTIGGVIINCYGVESSNLTTIGTHTFTGVTTNDLNLYVNNGGQGNLVGSIDNVSVKEIIEGTNNVSVNLSVYADGSDTLILNFDSSITAHNYYQTIEISSNELTQLKDETQYNIVGIDSNNKVIYRGKFQTTSKDLNNLSVNEGKYIKKTTATNYTILD